MVKTLNKLSELRETKYGQPPPRHGLNLLWWFAHYCIQIDFNKRIIAKCDPANGAFGFHRFYNRDRLLPKIYLPYYEVGNLHNAGSLPYYVTEYYTGYIDNSNTDRIIVSFDSRLKRFDNVYVTQHSDLVHFDQNRTYCISVDFLKNIQELSREEFLRGCRNRSEHISIDMSQLMQTNMNHKESPRTPGSNQLSIRRSQSVQESQTNTCQSWKCRCAAIGCVLMILLIAGVAVYLWWKTK